MKRLLWHPPGPAERYLQVLESPSYRLLARLYGLLVQSTFEHWRIEGGLPLLTPALSTAISSPIGKGSDSLPVTATIGSVTTYLSDSAQFLLEYGCRLTRQTAFYVAESFRGEDPDQTHLSQFFHSEAELIGNLEDAIAAVERYVARLIDRTLSVLGDELDSSGVGTSHLRAVAGQRPWPRVDFDEAASLLENDARFVLRSPCGGFRTLSRSGERRLLELRGPCLWLTFHDRLSVPFYQATCKENPERACNADLLLGLGEVCGAGERHSGGEQITAALREHGVDPRPYEWYVRMKETIRMQTSGFGLGLERFAAWVLRHDDIRDLQILPRQLDRDLVP